MPGDSGAARVQTLYYFCDDIYAEPINPLYKVKIIHKRCP